MENIKNKLLLKYRNATFFECPECSKNMSFSLECKNKCFEKVNNAQMFINSGIPNKYIDLSLNVFNDYTKKIKSINDKVNRNEVYESILEYIKTLEKNINIGKGILLFGSFGTGKSTLSMNIAKEAVLLNKKVNVREFSEMVKISQSGYAIDDNEPLDIFQEFVNSDLYCIENLDWVYQKNNSNYVSMFLDNLISLASKYNISLIITSNMTAKDIKKEFNEHIYSVLHENCIILNVPGEDIRLKK